MRQAQNTIKFKRVGGPGECSMDGVMKCTQAQFDAILEVLLQKKTLNFCEHMWEFYSPHPSSTDNSMKERCRFCGETRQIATAQSTGAAAPSPQENGK